MGNTMAAFKELMQRYHLVWQHAWARRHEMEAPTVYHMNCSFYPPHWRYRKAPFPPNHDWRCGY